MNRDQIRSLALECGFKLKDQGGGVMDLNPYVYDFSEKIIEGVRVSKKITVPVEIEVPDGMEFDGFLQGDVSSAIFPKFKKLKPAKKVIDLSCIVGSGIDCEFSSNQFNQGMISISPLREWCADRFSIDYAERTTGEWWKNCRVRQSPHVHYAVEMTSCPIPEGLRVRLIWLEDGYVTSDIVTAYLGFDWRDVIAFEVLGVADNARYEWEDEQ